MNSQQTDMIDISKAFKLIASSALLSLAVSMNASAYSLDFDRTTTLNGSLQNTRDFGIASGDCNQVGNTQGDCLGGVAGTIGMSDDNFGSGSTGTFHNADPDTVVFTFGIFAKNTGLLDTGGTLTGLGFFLPSDYKIEGTDDSGFSDNTGAHTGSVLISDAQNVTWTVRAFALATDDTVSGCNEKAGDCDVDDQYADMELFSGPLSLHSQNSNNSNSGVFVDFGFCASNKNNNCNGSPKDGIPAGSAGAFVLEFVSTTSPTAPAPNIQSIFDFASSDGTFWCARWRETDTDGEGSDHACGRVRGEPAVPEPAVAGLSLLGLSACLIGFSRRRRGAKYALVAG